MLNGGRLQGAQLDLKTPAASEHPAHHEAFCHLDPQGQEHLRAIRHKQEAKQASKSLFDPLKNTSLPLEEREANYRKALYERIDSLTIYEALPAKISDFLRALKPVLSKPTEYSL